MNGVVLRRTLLVLTILGLGGIALADKYRVVIPLFSIDTTVEVTPVEDEPPTPPTDSDGDGAEDSVDPCPDDPSNTCNDPPPVTDPNTHFNEVSAAASVSYSLRDPSNQVFIDYANGHGESKTIQYDSEFDAAKITLPAGRGSIPISDYLRLPFPPVSVGDTGEVSVQWEARWSDAYASAVSGGLLTQKAFRFDRVGSGEKRVLELQTRFSRATDGSVALPTFRSYFGAVGGDGSYDPLKAGDDWQPGGAEPLCCIQPGVWTRFTVSLTYGNGVQRVRLWVADENNDPVLLIADPVDSSQGFLCGTSSALTNVCQFCVLHNTSQEGLSTPELTSWVRNVVFYDGSTVPLGGRPVK